MRGATVHVPADATTGAPSRDAKPSAVVIRLSGASELLLFGYLPFLAVVGIFILAMGDHNMADFRVFWRAGRDVIAGNAGNFVYPPPVAVAVTPLALLPFQAAAVIWFALVVVSVAAILWLLGVRDWRCYGLTFLTAPILATLSSGAISSLLALGAAFVWVQRDRARIAAPCVALVVVAKVFMWPLLFWLAATRRWRTLGLATASMIVLLLATWAVIGFAGFAEYPEKLEETAAGQERSGYSLVALGVALHLPIDAARALWLLVLGVLLLAVLLAGRGRDGDRRAFALAVGATLVATPISWLHYFVLVFIVIALQTPRLGPVWFVPIGFWFCSMGSSGDLKQILAATGLTLMIFALGLRRRFGEGGSGAIGTTRRHSAAVLASPSGGSG
jgi:hypothetical protein